MAINNHYRQLNLKSWDPKMTTVHSSKKNIIWTLKVLQSILGKEVAMNKKTRFSEFFQAFLEPENLWYAESINW